MGGGLRSFWDSFGFFLTVSALANSSKPPLIIPRYYMPGVSILQGILEGNYDFHGFSQKWGLRPPRLSGWRGFYTAPLRIRHRHMMQGSGPKDGGNFSPLIQALMKRRIGTKRERLSLPVRSSTKRPKGRRNGTS